jgi:hypothetical protein
LGRFATGGGTKRGSKQLAGLRGSVSTSHVPLSHGNGHAHTYGQTNILPDVLEIGPGALVDHEAEERERLKNEAAQAIGLDLVQIQVQSPAIETGNEDEADDTVLVDRPVEDRNESSSLPPSSPTQAKTMDDSYVKSSSTTVQHRRTRSGSMPVPLTLSIAPPSFSRSTSSSLIPKHIQPASATTQHSASPTTTTTAASSGVPSIPAFPSTPSSLAPFTLATSRPGLLLKYHPASSLLVYALSKQWKLRYMVLSSPPPPPPTNQLTAARPPSPQPSYLHLFKSSDPNASELERLEINSDSVVFIADIQADDHNTISTQHGHSSLTSSSALYGRKNVIKVGGVSVSKGVNNVVESANEGAGFERTMWFLQFIAPTANTDVISNDGSAEVIRPEKEVQRWIEEIKNVIFGQR